MPPLEFKLEIEAKNVWSAPIVRASVPCQCGVSELIIKATLPDIIERNFGRHCPACGEWITGVETARAICRSYKSDMKRLAGRN